MFGRYALPFIALLLVAPARADSMMPMMEHMRGVMSSRAATPCAIGTVVRLNAALGRIVIRHTAVSGLDMPAMTTAFRVRNRTLLAGIKPGERVRFQVRPAEDGLVVTSLTEASQQR